MLRLLATFVEDSLWLLPHTLFFFYITTNATLKQSAYNFALYLVLILLPAVLIHVFYAPLFTTYLGGNIGKLITGLSVTDETGKRLSLKRSFFRYLIGYPFSGILFGLGFLAIIKDPNKQGWHDKAAGSRVVVSQNLWPLALVLLIGLLVANFLLGVKIVNNYKTGPLKPEIENLIGTAFKDSLRETLQEDKKARSETIVIQANTQGQFDDRLRIGTGNFRDSSAVLWISVKDDPSQDKVVRIHKGDEIIVDGYTLRILDVTENYVKLKAISPKE